MPRKRKSVPKNAIENSKLQDNRNAVKNYLCKVQTDEAYHKKYAKELRELYEKMEHDDFTAIFLVCLKQLMQSEFNQFTNTGLKFMASFVASFPAEDMHPLFDALFLWIFKTVSPNANIRLRLCEFVNQMLNSLPDDGDIEEFHCNEILSYMMDRLKDISPQVRVQAIKALCRLQNIDDPNDEVIQIFKFHLKCDPSPLVRQAVISSIARSAHTIPFILERLHDVDARVRRTVLARMSNYSLNKCTVDQRLTLIEEGLSDSSEAVRVIAVKCMLPQLLTLCDNNFVKFLTGLKLYRNEMEMNRFRSVAQKALLAMFRSHDPCALIKVLPLVDINGEANNSDQCCVELDQLTPELSVFWATLIEFFQSDIIYADHLDRILPDLPTICDNIARFSTQTDPSYDKWSAQCIFLSLIEMLQMNDLSDPAGRDSAKNIIVYLLVQKTCDEYLTKSLITLCEKVIPESNSRLQFYVEMVTHILHPIDLDGSLSSCKLDSNAKTEVSRLVEKLVEVRESRTKLLEANESNALEEEIGSVKKKLLLLTAPFLTDTTMTHNIERITSENLLRGLKFIFHGVCSESVGHLNPSMYQLYKDVISVRLESENLEVRNWALKCTATFGLLCSKLAGYAYHALCKQLFCHQVKFIWITCIRGIFQLIDRYGFDFLHHNQHSDTNPAPSTNDSLLNVTPMAGQSLDDKLNVPCMDHEHVSAADILLLFKRYLDQSQDVDITCELVDGFCMLIAHGRFFETEIMSKMIVMYFNADIEPIIVQILSVFFETLIRFNKQKYFQLSVREILTAIEIDQTFDENSLRLVLKFISNAMINETSSCSRLHNDLAATLLAWMYDQPTDSRWLNVVSKEIVSLRPLFRDEKSKWKLIELVDNMLDQKIPKECERNLKLFRNAIAQLNCTETALQFSSTRPADGVEENDAISNPDVNYDSELETDSNGNCDGSSEVVESNNKSQSDEVPIQIGGKRKRLNKGI